MKTVFICLILSLTACAKKCTPSEPQTAATPIQCYVANPSTNVVACTGANLGEEVMALDLASMFEVKTTQSIRSISITNMNWGTKAEPLALQSCISLTVFDSETQTTISLGTQCGANVDLEKRDFDAAY